MYERVYGPSFLAYQIENTPSDIRHFFLGASQECLDQLLKSIRAKNPGFQIVGSRNGYFGPEDEEDIVSEINAAKPDIVWVGLGTPKQQEWVGANKDKLVAGALLAVGFAFDVNAGTKSDAPDWMQPMGLTWLYRLMQEPRRLWKRYMLYNSVFLKELFLQQVRPEPSGGDTGARHGDGSVVDSDHRSEATDRCNVLGVGISAINLEMGTQRVLEGGDLVENQVYVTVTGVHGVMESRRDPGLRRIHNDSFLSTPDGMPMVWLGRMYGHESIGRVYGPDLMLEVINATAGSGRGHYFWGGKEGMAEVLAERMVAWFPETVVAGTGCPPFRALEESEERELVAELQKSKPHFMWVGLSTPKQERFMHGLIQRHPELTKGWDHGLIMLGVGAAFDFHTGEVHQAPRWMQHKGLEWLFRLCMEPRRLWKRYSINNTGFIFAIIAQLMGWKKYPIEK